MAIVSHLQIMYIPAPVFPSWHKCSVSGPLLPVYIMQSISQIYILLYISCFPSLTAPLLVQEGTENDESSDAKRKGVR